MKTLLRLKPRVKIMTDFYVFDVETGKEISPNIFEWLLNGRPESFIFGVIYGYNYTKVIHNLKEFHETFKEERFRGRTVFAHNATYDLNTLFDNIYKLDNSSIFNGSRFITCSNGNCSFADSLNIFVGQSVEKIGKQIGKEKIGMSGGDYKLSDWNKSEEKARDINGCIRDCEIIYDALLNSFEFAGDIKITQASLSMTYFRRNHQQYNIEHNEFTTCFWDSYFGGRTEAFKIGKVHANVWDINSSYPYAMQECAFPNPKFLKCEINVDLKLGLKIIENYEGCLYATIYHREKTYGALPYKRDGKLLFPIGSFSGCWNFNEIRFALEQGFITIEKIDKIVYAEKMVSPFISYVKALFDLKLQAEIVGDDFWRDLYKRFANSLYGKFAQRIDEESVYLENIERQYDIILAAQVEGTFVKLCLFNSKRLDAFMILKTNKQYSLNYAIPSFASYITSYSRILLLKELIKNERYKPVYCDTDSIFYELEPQQESVRNLGGWKRENKTVTEIVGLKNYKFIDHGKSETEIHRIKGVPILYYKNGIPNVEKNGNEYTYTNLIKTKESLRRSLEAGVQTKRKKVISGKYDKRIVYSNGETFPIKL